MRNDSNQSIQDRRSWFSHVQSIVDARGDPRQIELWELPKEDHRVDADRLRIVLDHATSEGVWFAYITILIGGGTVLYATGLFRSSSSLVVYGIGGVLGILTVIAIPITVRREIRKRQLRIVKFAIMLRYCACCGYDLVATPVQDDGCTVCPECGAAWRKESPAT